MQNLWCHKLGNKQLKYTFYPIPQNKDNQAIKFSQLIGYNIEQIYYIEFPRYLTVLLTSDFYYIFLCYSIALKIELSYKFFAEFCNVRSMRWTIHSIPIPQEKACQLSLSLSIISKSTGSSNYFNKLRLSIKQMIRDIANKPTPLI